MAMWSLTAEKKEELLRKKDDKQKELDDLRKTSKEQLWERDLEEFLTKLDEVEAKEREDDLVFYFLTKVYTKKMLTNFKPGVDQERSNFKSWKEGSKSRSFALSSRCSVAPRIPEELKTKVAKAAAAKDRKEGKVGTTTPSLNSFK